MMPKRGTLFHRLPSDRDLHPSRAVMKARQERDPAFEPEKPPPQQILFSSTDKFTPERTSVRLSGGPKPVHILNFLNKP